jgi:hypothetical protein
MTGIVVPFGFSGCMIEMPKTKKTVNSQKRYCSNNLIIKKSKNCKQNRESFQGA